MTSHAPASKSVARKRGPLRFLPLAIALGLGVLIAALIYEEFRASPLQAQLFSAYGKRLSFEMQPGANPNLRIPKSGPYNERLGYRYLPYYVKALQADDYIVAEQVHPSPAYERLIRRGIYPVYHPKTVAGLTFYDSEGQILFATSYPKHIFAAFGDIPPLLVDTLLHIENRELLREGPPTRNPVIEWSRFVYALFGQVFRPFNPDLNTGGGSTLATQIEKFRFSPQGKTGSILEKLRQIASASFRVYLDGSDTRPSREKIVLDYLNSTPLSARAGFGEVNSIGDGLWAWFGLDLPAVAAKLNLGEDNPDDLKEKAKAYRATLALILAQRRPTFYLLNDREALGQLVDATLERLDKAHVISTPLHEATKKATLDFLREAPQPPEPPYIGQKAANTLRAHLMNLLGLKNLYEVDRLDLSGRTTFNGQAQAQLIGFIKQTPRKDFLQENGLYGFRLLKPQNDPAKIKWSVMLYEQGPDANRIRLQADNIDGPFDMNEGMKLDLGSTAKLRTVVTYLEIISELHRRYAGLEAEDLDDLGEDAPDNLTAWAIRWLGEHPEADLEAMLAAALERRYSASPGEVFFTGSGIHTFHNFEPEEDYKIFGVREAFRHSVNLVFIRLMRDIVNYTIAQGPQTKKELLSDDENPARQAYLERFADQEGSVFLNRYIAQYKGLAPEARVKKLLARAHKGAVAHTVLFRSLDPKADFNAYAAFMQQNMKAKVPEARLTKLFETYPADGFTLEDRAYLSGINPMELWLLGYWQQHPDAAHRELMSESRAMRIASYAWLYKSGRKQAQNTRIRIMLEKDAFAHIQKRWARLGYPFERLVPSFATAIGSSADRPGALAELVGIILADGKRLPVKRFESLEFGKDTPFETRLALDPNLKPPQVLSPVVARTVKQLMAEVVENGTAGRAKGVYVDASGKPLVVGGKTGTGDQRFEEFAAGGRLISSRIVNRTGTFVFYIGDKFFGTITAHVAGEDAGDYVFTSALSAQMLRALAPIINPVVNGAAALKESAQAVQP